MDKKSKQFTPKLVDEQVDRLLAHQPVALPEESLLNDLQQMYQDDEHSLKQVWQRLGLEDSLPVGVEEQPRILRSGQFAKQPPASAGILDLERIRQMQQPVKHSIARRLTFIAAACVAALVITSMLWIGNLTHQGKSPTVGGRHTPQQQVTQLAPGLYVSNMSYSPFSKNDSNMFRLDPQTQQVLWQQPLKNVIRIIPAGNIVYALQSTSSVYSPVNAVVAINANTGKTLWTHAFAQPQSKKDKVEARPQDMVLAQNQLYVGWQIWDETNNTTTAQIYVLNASTGAQRNAYPATSYTSSLAAGDGILAVSVDNGLQVYDPNSGKSLWHVSVTAPTSAPVVSVRVVDGLVYAVFSTNNGEMGFGQSYIAAYKATTGQLVWKSPSFPGDALSKFTVDHNIVYFGTLITNTQSKPFSGSVYAYDVQQNKKLWSQHVDGGVQTAPIVSNDVVYVAADNGSHFQGHIVALTASKGEIKWQQTLANGFTNGFCLTNGVIYVGNFSVKSPAPAPDGMYALKADDGSKLWVDNQHGSGTIIVPTA